MKAGKAPKGCFLNIKGDNAFMEYARTTHSCELKKTFENVNWISTLKIFAEIKYEQTQNSRSGKILYLLKYVLIQLDLVLSKWIICNIVWSFWYIHLKLDQFGYVEIWADMAIY